MIRRIIVLIVFLLSAFLKDQTNNCANLISCIQNPPHKHTQRWTLITWHKWLPLCRTGCFPLTQQANVTTRNLFLPRSPEVISHQTFWWHQRRSQEITNITMMWPMTPHGQPRGGKGGKSRTRAKSLESLWGPPVSQGLCLMATEIFLSGPRWCNIWLSHLQSCAG